MKKKAVIAGLVLLFSIGILTIKAKAEEININCKTLSGADSGSVLDNDFNTTNSFSKDEEITIYGDTSIDGIYIKWDTIPTEWTLKGNGQEAVYGKNDFLHEYVQIPKGWGDLKEVTLVLNNSNATIADIYAFSEGELPDWVQEWEDQWDNADILVLSTHADDEALFFGGIIPNYTNAQRAKVQVAYFCHFWDEEPFRHHELLDCLWTMGVTHYPELGHFPDKYCETLDSALGLFDKNKSLDYVVWLIRKFKPQVLVGHDLKGEYGHGVHMLTAQLITEAIEISNDESKYPESASEFGIWDVPKTYIHLYETNLLVMDARTPLESFGGKTALDVAKEAYAKHISQQAWGFVVDDQSKYSCSKFGLYRTLVGNDVHGGDVMENLVSYYEQDSKGGSKSLSASEKTTIITEIKDFFIRLWIEESIWRKIIVAVGILIVAAIIILITNVFGKRKRKRKSKDNPYYDENGNEIKQNNSEQTISWKQSGFGDIVDVNDVEIKEKKEEKVPEEIMPNEKTEEKQSFDYGNWTNNPAPSAAVERTSVSFAGSDFNAENAVANTAKSATIYSMGLENDDMDVTPVSPEDFYSQLSERTGKSFVEESNDKPSEIKPEEPERLSILEEAAAVNSIRSAPAYNSAVEEYQQYDNTPAMREEDIANAIYSEDILGQVIEEGAAYSDLFSDDMVNAFVASEEVNSELHDNYEVHEEVPEETLSKVVNEEIPETEAFGEQSEVLSDSVNLTEDTKDDEEVYPEDFEALLKMDVSEEEAMAMDNILDDLLSDGKSNDYPEFADDDNEYMSQTFGVDNEEELSEEESADVANLLGDIIAIDSVQEMTSDADQNDTSEFNIAEPVSEYSAYGYSYQDEPMQTDGTDIAEPVSEYSDYGYSYQNEPMQTDETGHVTESYSYEWTEFDPYLPREYRELPEEDFFAAQLGASAEPEPPVATPEPVDEEEEEPLPRDDEFFGFIKKFKEEKKEQAEIVEAEVTLEEKIDKLFHES